MNPLSTSAKLADAGGPRGQRGRREAFLRCLKNSAGAVLISVWPCMACAQCCPAFVVPPVTEPAPKQDIRGFFPGMTPEEFEQRLRTSKCVTVRERMDPTLGGFGIRISPMTECRLNEQQGRPETLAFAFTTALPERLLQEIEFTFVSGTPFQELVQQVSEQYGAQSKAVRSESGVADWGLDDGLLLRLSTVLGGLHTLTLISKRMCALDAQAAEEKRRSVNPRPRF